MFIFVLIFKRKLRVEYVNWITQLLPHSFETKKKKGFSAKVCFAFFLLQKELGEISYIVIIWKIQP